MPSLADEANDRKTRSEAILRAEQVPVLDSLPPIETTTTSQRRDTEEVIQRLIALYIIACAGNDKDAAATKSRITRFDAANYFTPAEQAYLNTPTPEQQLHIDASWRIESANTLIWALSLTPTLSRADQTLDQENISTLIEDLGPEGLRAKAKLRPQSELLDAADLNYRSHWAVVNAQLSDQPAPAKLDGDVVYERLYTLNWIIGYMGQAWDDISTDT